MSLTAGSWDRFVTDSIDACPACHVAPSSVRSRTDAEPMRSTVPWTSVPAIRKMTSSPAA